LFQFNANALQNLQTDVVLNSEPTHETR